MSSETDTGDMGLSVGSEYMGNESDGGDRHSGDGSQADNEDAPTKWDPLSDDEEEEREKNNNIETFKEEISKIRVDAPPMFP